MYVHEVENKTELIQTDSKALFCAGTHPWGHQGGKIDLYLQRTQRRHRSPSGAWAGKGEKVECSVRIRFYLRTWQLLPALWNRL